MQKTQFFIYFFKKFKNLTRKYLGKECKNK